MYFANYVWTDFVCFTPNDGFYVKMTNVLYPERGFRITKGYRQGFRGYRNLKAPLWGFGRTWYSSDAQVVTCKSRRTGLTCRHYQGHGWWLGRYRGYRIFSAHRPGRRLPA
jgi:hypothetical protein